MTRTDSITVADHLRNIPATVRPTVVAARQMVLATAPHATEIVYQSHSPRSASTMWKLFRYSLGGAKVIGIGTFRMHSTVFFYRGRELEDGSGLLHGSGKDARFITLQTPADALRPDLKRMVHKAFQLAR
jgi:hypothetical protein